MQSERKSIPGFEGYYDIDIYGRVYSIERIVKKSNGKIQKISACERKISSHISGYKTVRLCKDGITKSYRLHRLVALTFLPNPNSLPQVNHVDGDKNNNALFQKDGNYQLEWCDQDHNMKHASENGLTATGLKNAATKIDPELISGIMDRCLNGEFVTDVAKEFGVNRNTLTKAFYKTSRAQEWRDDLSRRRKIANDVKNSYIKGISV